MYLLINALKKGLEPGPRGCSLSFSLVSPSIPSTPREQRIGFPEFVKILKMMNFLQFLWILISRLRKRRIKSKCMN
jgi:hypothetical protein